MRGDLVVTEMREITRDSSEWNEALDRYMFIVEGAVPAGEKQGRFVTLEDEGRVVFIGGPGQGGGGVGEGPQDQRSYRELRTVEEAQAFLDERESPINAAFEDYPRDAWGGGGGPEVDALQSYVGNGYTDINHRLRHSQNPDALASYDPDVKAIDALMSREESVLREPVVLNRAFGSRFFRDKEVGSTFDDAAYVSTSARPDFRKFGPTAKILIPAGVRVVSGQAVSYKRHEMEAVLERGLTFRVLQNDDQGVVVEVVK
jgi:hypothetical protein